jgi:acetyl-CoA synthetase
VVWFAFSHFCFVFSIFFFFYFCRYYYCCYSIVIYSLSLFLSLGFYFTGDGARRDNDGYYWITGRVDDVINPSGHRIGTAEIESALVACHQVAEAAVIGFPHEIKGEGIGCFIILREGYEGSPDLTAFLKTAVRNAIGPIATPDFIVYCDLPKTRSGKIMRRILRKISSGEEDSIGDVSTLADPTVVERLVIRFKEAYGTTSPREPKSLKY